MHKPYVGITGFTEKSQILALIGQLDVLNWPSTHQVMAGILVSDKSLKGQPLKPLWQNKYPAPETVESLLVPDNRLLYLVHFNSHRPDFADELWEVLELAPSTAGFQLNLCWPDPREIERYRLRPHTTEDVVVLQVGSRALQAVDSRPDKLLSRLRDYQGLVEYLLLDPSGGLGRELDSAMATNMVKELAEAGLNIGLGVAGGLEAGTVERLRPMLASYPWLSWDSEGRLRTGDRLDLAKCYDYLSASLQLITQAQPTFGG